MNTESDVRYEVQSLGRMWMPQCEAATTLTVTTRDLVRAGHSEQYANDPDSGRCAVEMYVSTHSGDFSEVLALRIERVATTVEYDGPSVDGAHQRITRTLSMVLRDFTEDEEMRFSDCMWGDFDYEDEEVLS